MFSIEFNTINILLITAHAFYSTAFVHHLQLNFGLLSNVITELCFYGTDLMHINNNFLQPLFISLLNVNLNNFPATTNLTNFFGTLRFKFLVSVSITGNKSQLVWRTLEAINFLRLVRIKRLALAQCSIDCIQADTFKFISETLKSLDLSDNLLKFIDIAWFFVFLDDLKFRYSFVVLDGNPIVCNCSFYQIRNLTVFAKMNHRNDMVELQLFESIPACVMDTVGRHSNVQTCETLQIISNQKLYLTKSIERPYGAASKNAFPMFSIHIAHNQYSNNMTTVAIIKIKFTVNFRLLILNYHQNQNVIKRKCH